MWYIPDGGLVDSLTNWTAELVGHSKKVSYIEWHPTAADILLSAAADLQVVILPTGRYIILPAGHYITCRSLCYLQVVTLPAGHYTLSQKNDTDVTHYRFNLHQPISVIFGGGVAERVCY